MLFFNYVILLFFKSIHEYIYIRCNSFALVKTEGNKIFYLIVNNRGFLNALILSYPGLVARIENTRSLVAHKQISKL